MGKSNGILPSLRGGLRTANSFGFDLHKENLDPSELRSIRKVLNDTAITATVDSSNPRKSDHGMLVMRNFSEIPTTLISMVNMLRHSKDAKVSF